ncbi:apolipoL family protein [Helicobacter pylori]
MHAHIDDDIENEECKIIFKHELQKGMEKSGENIKKRFEKDEQQFLKDIKETIKQFEERTKDSLAMLEYISIYSGNTDFNFNIDSGINKLGLFASIGGLVILGLVNFWNPMGWIELGLAGLLGLVGVVKSVRSFFDSGYKKSQQRKEVDKSLDKVCEKIEEDVRNRIEDAKKGISEKIESLKARLNDPVVCYEHMREGLIIAGEGLWQIDNNIKTRIAQ